MEAFKHRLIIISLLLTNLRSIASSPDSHGYDVGDHVPLFVNKVGPLNNPSETYQYYELPFCRPGEAVLKADQSNQEEAISLWLCNLCPVRSLLMEKRLRGRKKTYVWTAKGVLSLIHNFLCLLIIFVHFFPPFPRHFRPSPPLFSHRPFPVRQS